MAAITTAGSGNWSSTTPNAPWPSGTVPTSADTVTIAKNHVVTLDTSTAVCSSLTAAVGTTTGDVGGKLTCSTTVSTKLTIQTGGTFAGATGGSGAYSSDIVLDVSADPTIKCEIVLANAGSAADLTIAGNCTLRGASKTAWSELMSTISAGATSAQVTNASGWRVGDVVVFASTVARNWTSPGTDTVTLTSVNTSTGEIGWSGGVSFAHSAGATAGNFTRNLVIGPASSSVRGDTAISSLSTMTTRNAVCDYVLFSQSSNGGSFESGVLIIGSSTAAGSRFESVSGNAFLNNAGTAIQLRKYFSNKFTRDRNIFFPRKESSGKYIQKSDAGTSVDIGPDTNYAIFSGHSFGLYAYAPNQHQIGHRISGVTPQYDSLPGAGIVLARSRMRVESCKIWGCLAGVSSNAGAECESNTYGSAVFSSAPNGSDVYVVDGFHAETASMLSNPINILGPAATNSSVLLLLNKGADLGIQELYSGQSLTTPAIQRTTTTVNRSTSSFEFTLNASIEQTYEFKILAKAGDTATIKTYVRKNSSYGAATLPSVTVSGLGITPVVSIMAAGTAADAWELLTTSATNSSASDGLLTVTFAAQSSTAGAKAYFSGTPCAPFVTRARHYGYQFLETIPTVVADTYVSASEATAAAYTGVTINNTTKEIAFAAGTADTAQKFYDYSRYWCVEDVSRDVPFTRAGTLYSLLSTWTVIDPYYAGTLTWSGGTVQYTSTGTKSDNLDGCIVEFNVATGGTFSFDGTLSGTLDLRNLDDTAITVEVPTGTTYTTANNTGGTITVSTPQTYQSVTISGATAGSRIQIYDTTSSTELYNGTPSFPYTWTDSTPYSADRAIRLRVAYVSGTSAKEFIDQAIGTCTLASPALSYLVTQTDDAVYNANAINGSTLTGYSITGSTLVISVSDGSATWPEMYAYECYWLSTSGGIADQDLYIQAIDTANYVFYGGFKIKNTSSPSVPLLITGGNGEPATGLATDLLDTTGGSIFVNSSIVVPYSSGAEATVDIVKAGLTAQGYSSTRATGLDNLDATVSSRLASAGYTAPDNAAIADAVWSKTLP